MPKRAAALPVSAKSRRRLLLGLLAVGGVLRIGLFLYRLFLDTPYSWVPLSGDTFTAAGIDGYLQLAHNWLAGQGFTLAGYPVAHRPPITPALLSLTTVWNPSSWWLNWTVVGLVGYALSGWLMLQLVWQLGLAFRWQLLAVGVLALHPAQVALTSVPTYLPVVVPIGLAVASTAIAWLREPTPWRALALGALLALGGLTHGSLALWGLGFVGFTLGWLAWPWRLRLRQLGWVSATALALISPWVIRNQVVFGEDAPLLVSGIGLQHWAAKGYYEGNMALPVEVYRERTGEHLPNLYHGTATPKQDAILREAAWADIQAKPGAFVERYLNGLLRFWAPFNSYAWVRGLIAFPLLLLSLLSIVRLGGWARVRPETGFLARMVFGLWVFMAAMNLHTGYCSMVEPLLGLFAAALASRAFSKQPGVLRKVPTYPVFGNQPDVEAANSQA